MAVFSALYWLYDGSPGCKHGSLAIGKDSQPDHCLDNENKVALLFIHNGHGHADISA
jgi:hypothetical protein